MTAYAQPASAIAAAPQRSLGRAVIRWVTTTDHKQIGYLYLVTSFVPGEPFAVAGLNLNAAAKREVAATLGRLLHPVHDLAIPTGSALGDGWDDWSAFIERQRQGVAERHRAWSVLPEHLLGEIDGYVAGYRIPEAVRPSLVHADLHDHHLIGAGQGPLCIDRDPGIGLPVLTDLVQTSLDHGAHPELAGRELPAEFNG